MGFLVCLCFFSVRFLCVVVVVDGGVGVGKVLVMFWDAGMRKIQQKEWRRTLR